MQSEIIQSFDNKTYPFYLPSTLHPTILFLALSFLEKEHKFRKSESQQIGKNHNEGQYCKWKCARDRLKRNMIWMLKRE